MRRMKNKKLKAILSLSGYFLLILALCFVGGLVFHSYYYELVYVSGTSMSPTLNGQADEKAGSVVDFGIVDRHQSAINHIERFDIISTYYPYKEGRYEYDYTADGTLKASAKMKIKRVIALPGETFTIKDGLLSVKKGDEFVNVPYTFKINLSETHKNGKDISEKKLAENEYWVLGDNRDSSTDSAYIDEPIKKDNIVGVLVAIEGKAQLKLKNYICQTCGKTYKGGDKCSECDGFLGPQYTLTNKQYHWPKYY